MARRPAKAKRAKYIPPGRRWPDLKAIKIRADLVVVYHGLPLVPIWPTGRRWNDGKDEYWDSEDGARHPTKQYAAEHTAKLAERKILLKKIAERKKWLAYAGLNDGRV